MKMRRRGAPLHNLDEQLQIYRANGAIAASTT